VQFAKVGIALVEGKTGAAKISGIATDYDAMTVTTEGGLEALDEVTGGTENSVKPLTFKSLVGKGHAEFSSSRQQDAQEYFSYLMDIMQRAEHSAGNRLVTDKSTAKLFQFQTEARIECMESGKVWRIVR
jgi:ubiquitin carboxyl-terminal hydrolase 5/13